MGGATSTALASANEATDSVSTAAYRPHLDGLRAIAVYLVVLFHAGSESFAGGFIGVDVFFVLSGFLVTQLLLRDLTTGSIRFGRFYARRFRRLLPAAFVTLLVTAVVFTAIARPGEVADAVGSFKAAFLYVANWYFIHHSSGYFGADISQNPVLQFWSLAIEEQFYLVWPLTLGGLFLATRRLDRARQIRMIRIVVIVGVVASALWALSLRNRDLNRAYYGTDTRAYELLAGAFLALTPAWASQVKRYARSLRITTWVGIGALVVLATEWVHLDAIERGVAATIVTCVLLVSIEAVDGGLVKRALSSNTMTYLGRVSYGTYLWHWLVILVAVRTFAPKTIATIGVAFLVSTALAALSFEILERPVRMSVRLDGHRRTVVAAGLAISLVSALVIIPQIVDPARASTSAVEKRVVPRLTPIPKTLDWKGEGRLFPNCFQQPVSECTVVKGTGKRILLLGDSHARMLIPTFTAIAEKDDLTLSVDGEPSCPWQRGLYTLTSFSSCQKLKTDAYRRVIDELKPDIVVVMNLDYGKPGKDYPHMLTTFHGRKASLKTLTRLTAASVKELTADARQLIIVEPIPLAFKPSPNFEPLRCLERARVAEECQYTANTRSSPLEQMYRDLAQDNDRVRSLDLDKQVCPLLPVCNPIVNGEIVKRDPSHLTAQFARSLAPYVETYLRSVGLLPLDGKDN
jgi:peptidoglycan/LPS O-acetylase OafA/YrhL